MLRVEVDTSLGDLRLTVALEVAQGECVAVVGPSGAGKSSLLRVVAGLLRPTTGRVSCGDQVWLSTADAITVPPEHRRVGFVFQDYALFPHLSAWRNVAYGIAAPPDVRRKQALALLDRLDLGARADARPATLSGGERQRVALARALARSPEVLLLDEPLSALDPRARAEGAHVLGTVLADSGAPAILVTHSFEEAALLGARVAVLERGTITQIGTADELAAAPATPFVAELAGAAVLDGAVVFPWEFELVEPDAHPATVTWVRTIGSRARVGLLFDGQAVVAETTPAHVARLGLRRGAAVGIRIPGERRAGGAESMP